MTPALKTELARRRGIVDLRGAVSKCPKLKFQIKGGVMNLDKIAIAELCTGETLYESFDFAIQLLTSPRYLQYHLQTALRNRFKYPLMHPRCSRKSKIAFTKLVGCTIEEFNAHLEKHFRHGMTWGNQGSKGWVIDHIVPLPAFDLRIKKEQRECFHFSNTQPLWKSENSSKGNSINYAIPARN